MNQPVSGNAADVEMDLDSHMIITIKVQTIRNGKRSPLIHHQPIVLPYPFGASYAAVHALTKETLAVAVQNLFKRIEETEEDA